MVTVYALNPEGQVIHETDANLNFNVHYIYLGGQLMAEMKDGTTYFAHTDHLDSVRLLTKIDQSGYDYFDNLPFGELIGGGSGTTHKFTGDERDSETNLDHTWFRQYSSQFGRWTTPDPARLPDGQAGLMAVSLDAPQSLNRYSYVNNMPLSYFDPTGLFESCPPNSGPNIQNSDGTTGCGDAGPHMGGLNDAVPCKDYYVNGFDMGSSCRSGDDIIIWRWDAADHVRFSDGTTGANKKNNKKPNFFNYSNCQYQFLDNKYGPGAAKFVSRFSLLGFTPLASGPSANASDAFWPSVGTEAAKGTAWLVFKTAGSEAGVLGVETGSFVPTLYGTAVDAEAKYACKDVTPTSGLGLGNP